MLQNLAEASLSDWGSFYVITGSAAAALTGLQFVVMALINDTRRRSSTASIDAFGTPNIVHFCAVLLVSAAMSAPWRVLSHLSLLIGACGIAGAIYALLVARRAKLQPDYVPVLEDWIWHVALPFISYLALLIAAILLFRHEADALFTMGAAALLLLFIGIHNAWDTITYLVVERVSGKDGESQ
jgi:hypothetical protein